ncbi:T9SS type A sorting domain-containing protein [Flavobacterium sp. TBRC 19031]|uniref:T9SS type A sorting domain-containing protein n=1 Tax=Flavobacterium mekongense TaxID=3379707 RepID=UPI00399C249E
MKKITLLLALLLCMFISNAQVVTTIAGSTPGYTDAVGTSAQFFGPRAVCLDNNGYMYVADYTNNLIRKIELATNTVSTLAGSTVGFADGVGTAAQFNGPSGICTDNNGNLYVTDYFNFKIRKIVIATGEVSTYTGSTFGYANGDLATAQFNAPVGICKVGDYLYVTESINTKIRKIDLVNGIVSTLAGSIQGTLDGFGEAAQFDGLSGICSDGSGNLYVAEINNHRIRKVVISTGEVTTFAGSTPGFNNGTGTSAGFNNPMGLAISNQNYLFVVDYGNNRIRKIDLATAAVTNFVGAAQGFADGTSTAAKFSEPMGICFDPNGLLFIADRGNHKIRKVTAILKTEEFVSPLSLKIYPNPAVDSFTVETNMTNEASQLIITDCVGKEVYKQKTEQLTTTVYTSNLSKGMYFVTLNQGQKSVTQKLIIQ